jgi:hypothetical protein
MYPDVADDIADVVAIGDDELAALAMAADPDARVDPDARSVWELAECAPDASLLPEWYMPAGPGRVHLVGGWRRRVVLALVVAFIAVDALGLCSTYGWITWA